MYDRTVWPILRRNGVLVALLIALAACSTPGFDSGGGSGRTPVLDLSGQRVISEAQARAQLQDSLQAGADRPQLVLVTVSGKVFAFGVDVFTGEFKEHGAGEPDTHIWFAEYPFTQLLDLQSDADGRWEVKILKPADRELELSIVYRKDFDDAATEQLFESALGIPLRFDAVTVRSETFVVGDQSLTDRAIQLPDELYLTAAVHDVEQAIRTASGDAAYSVQNILVTTIGKAWAAMSDDRLPHGDPGAFLVDTETGETLLPNSPLLTLYFTRDVVPEPGQIGSSVDGGVALFNVPAGRRSLSATKPGFEYGTIVFDVTDEYSLYISSPPQAIIGTNRSDPGDF